MARKKLTPPTARRRGRSKARSINFGWWGAISLIVVLGIVAVVVSRDERASADIVQEVTAPAIGDATTVTVSAVEVEPYDRVESDETLFTVTVGDTEEAVVSPITGIVSEILVAEGDEVEPGARLANVQTGPDFSQANPAGNHWHTAYGVNICGQWLPPIGQFESDFHTHGSGLVHAHPRSTSAAGDNATLGLFFERAGLDLTINKLEYADGNTYEDGEVDCDGESGVFRWALNGEEQDGNPATFVVGNGDVVALAFVPEDADFDTLPPSAAGMAENYVPPKHPDFAPPEDPAPAGDDTDADSDAGDGGEAGGGAGDDTDDGAEDGGDADGES